MKENSQGRVYQSISNSDGITVVIWRNPPAGKYSLGEIAQGIEETGELRRLAEQRGKNGDFITRTGVTVDSSRDFYMYVDDSEGRLMICSRHLSDSDIKTVYLDLVHEMVHMFQLDEGRNLFDRRHRYVNRPTEREAYRIAVAEGRKVGMTEAELFEYLYVDWISSSDHRKLAGYVGVRVPDDSG
ncbi:MAG: hypothetical protein KIY12_06115 [Thermoplasmata archaeon]|uniref:Uncharacterized protein n=1 Tax=Candidatus Sysuiplasma superficiale TaxID=2823368 RepID=A0A8J7YJ80_9ARCH|nr:hypothetical protein [Candidatus Sysuiplasma superficiale]MBX8644281.1 hypothetical protein [Candidatus Sysuiplasma superficiale]